MRYIHVLLALALVLAGSILARAQETCGPLDGNSKPMAEVIAEAGENPRFPVDEAARKKIVYYYNSLPPVSAHDYSEVHVFGLIDGSVIAIVGNGGQACGFIRIAPQGVPAFLRGILGTAS